jgi:hypothetical protein
MDPATLPQCPAFDLALRQAFHADPLNQFWLQAPCAPAGFSGTGRVRKIVRSETGGKVDLIEVALDTPHRCGTDGASLNIGSPAADWGLQVGSPLRVDVVGNDDDDLLPTRSGHAAVVWRADGQLLAASFYEYDEFLPRFLARLPVAIRFELDCRANPVEGCYRTRIDKALVLPSEAVRLRPPQSTRVSRAGVPFHLALSSAQELTDGDGRPCGYGPFPPGFGYAFTLQRLP